MRINAILHYLGLILAIIGATMLLPLLWSFFHGESEAATAFAISLAFSVVAGLILWRFVKPRETNLSRREAVTLVAIGWVCISLVSAYLIRSPNLRTADAFSNRFPVSAPPGAAVFLQI